MVTTMDRKARMTGEAHDALALVAELHGCRCCLPLREPSTT